MRFLRSATLTTIIIGVCLVLGDEDYDEDGIPHKKTIDNYMIDLTLVIDFVILDGSQGEAPSDNIDKAGLSNWIEGQFPNLDKAEFSELRWFIAVIGSNGIAKPRNDRKSFHKPPYGKKGWFNTEYLANASFEIASSQSDVKQTVEEVRSMAYGIPESDRPYALNVIAYIGTAEWDGSTVEWINWASNQSTYDVFSDFDLVILAPGWTDDHPIAIAHKQPYDDGNGDTFELEIFETIKDSTNKFKSTIDKLLDRCPTYTVTELDNDICSFRNRERTVCQRSSRFNGSLASPTDIDGSKYCVNGIRDEACDQAECNTTCDELGWGFCKCPDLNRYRPLTPLIQYCGSVNLTTKRCPDNSCPPPPCSELMMCTTIKTTTRRFDGSALHQPSIAIVALLVAICTVINGHHFIE